MALRLPVQFRLDSLAFRVIASSTVWALATLVIVATVISTFYRQASERGFESLMSAHLFNLIGSVGVSPEGELQGSPNLGDLRFMEPNSGWYWVVEPASDDTTGILTSPSLVEPIAGPTPEEVPFDSEFQRRYLMEGLEGEWVDVLESELFLDGQGRIGRFRVMGNYTELEREIAAFDRQLYLYLAIFGIGMIAINAIAILIGLQPLNRVRRALADIRAGTATRLDGKFPAEIAPLAAETNALIESNRRIIERSRTQVGNLAHSLKTPLAVLVNEGRALGGARGTLISEQSDTMRQQIEHYLQRARSAAQRDMVVFRTPAREALERMLRVMAKLNRHIDLASEMPEQEVVFAGEKEDFEEICGNLLENAFKWAREMVAVRLRSVDEGGGRFLELTIEDDGPGIPKDQARLALERGKRLDETKPGTGLGLSIVSELVGEYGGTLSLGEARLGGLMVTVRLRRVED